MGARGASTGLSPRSNGNGRRRGKREDFARLKPWLTGEAAHGDQAATARALGMNEGALKVAVHRLRRRFRELLKAEIAQTLERAEAIGDEMRQLFAALGGA